MKKDVLLLADVFEKFISACLKFYNLDPCHYFSAPGLSWDTMLKLTKIELGKISNADMYLFIKKEMRESISYINKRYSKANNKYCPDYDKTKPEKYINYIDINNLYEGGMSQYLPYEGFKWVKINNEIINRILNEKDGSLHGHFLEVDLDYPENLHNSHEDYPLAPEKIKIKEELLSPYCLENAKKFDTKTEGINKLVRNLVSKKNYVVNYGNLKYYLSQGLVLKYIKF